MSSLSSKIHDRVIVNFVGSVCNPKRVAISELGIPSLCCCKQSKMDSLRSLMPFLAFSCASIFLIKDKLGRIGYKLLIPAAGAVGYHPTSVQPGHPSKSTERSNDP